MYKHLHILTHTLALIHIHVYTCTNSYIQTYKFLHSNVHTNTCTLAVPNYINSLSNSPFKNYKDALDYYLTNTTAN